MCVPVIIIHHCEKCTFETMRIFEFFFFKLTFVIMTTKKSFGLTLHPATVSVSFKTFPEYISFMLAAGNSELVCSYTHNVMEREEKKR